MSSLIEQAAERLEQLRQAGVVIPPMASAPVSEPPGIQAQRAFADPASERSILPISDGAAHPRGRNPRLTAIPGHRVNRRRSLSISML
jgi:hypothetical protein